MFHKIETLLLWITVQDEKNRIKIEEIADNISYVRKDNKQLEKRSKRTIS